MSRTPGRQIESVVCGRVGEWYRLAYTIMALVVRDNHEEAVRIQAGAILEVVGPAQDDRFVIVDAMGQRVLIFKSDLKNRGKLMDDRKARPVVQHGGHWLPR